MVQKIYAFEKRKDYTIEVTFFNGDIKQFDMSLLFEVVPEFSQFEKDMDKISEGMITRAKDAIDWGDGVRISAEQLWYDGILVGEYNIENPAVKLACMLIEARYKSGLSQRELEGRTGIKQAEISKIERAEGNPSIATVGKLLAGMGRVIGFDSAYNKNLPRTDISVPASCASYLNPDRKQGQFTTRDIDMLPEDVRVELLDGILYDMAMPTYTHERIVAEILGDFIVYIRSKKGQCIATASNTGVYFDHDNKNFVVPDVVVICDKSKAKKKGVVGGPDFVLEVVSPSSRIRDIRKKEKLYSEKGVREYWIIDPERKTLIVNNYEDEYTYGTEIHGLNEVVGVGIYGGELKIDLNKIAEIIAEETEYE